MYLLEDKGEVSLYRNDNNQIVVKYKGETINLIGIKWDQNAGTNGIGWRAISADIYEGPYSNNNGNILLLWKADPDQGNEWQAISFSSDDGMILGMYGDSGYYYSSAEMRSEVVGSSESITALNDRWFGRDIFIDSNGGWVKNSTEAHDQYEINQLGVLFPEIYYGVAKVSAK